MAWRFKASKYKNAAPIVPKFEQHIRDLVSIILFRGNSHVKWLFSGIQGPLLSFRRSAATAPMATSSLPARPTWPSTGTPTGPTWPCCRSTPRADNKRCVINHVINAYFVGAHC